MKTHLLAMAISILLIGGAAAQSIHPPTREGFGAKPKSPEAQREGKPDASRPEAQGGADSQQNLQYGRETEAEGKKLHEGMPPDNKR